MRRIIELAAAAALLAQRLRLCLARELSAPNAAGVAMGHLHYVVRDVAANKAFWVALGGRSVLFNGTTEGIVFPDVVVLLRQGEPTGGTRRLRRQSRRVSREVRRRDRERRLRSRVQRAVSGRRVRAHARRRAHRAIRRRARDELGLHDRRRRQRRGRGAAQPQDRRADHRAPHSSQRADRSGRGGEGVVRDALRRRARQALALRRRRSARHQHQHLRRRREPKRRRAAACSITSASRSTNLEAFCKELEAAGIKFDRPYGKLPSGFGLAFLTDPWGTYIELTEGLRDL